MNTFAPDPSILELAHSVTPIAVSQYLATQPWELESRQDHIREIWRLPGDDGQSLGRVLLPLATDYADFLPRFYDALFAISRVHDWDAEKLQERIAAARADLFFVRLDQEMTDGTIPFRQAEITVDAIWKMLRAAATTAADPEHSHLGRRPAAVADFLDEDVRLGHTRRGSFVFTVVTRLGDQPPERQADQPPGVIRPFPRRVMETLAQGLETTRNLTLGQNLTALDEPSRWGLSAGLVEAIEEMAEPDGLRALDLSFEWAAAETKPSVGESPIKLEHQAFGQLGRFRERLIRQEEPKRRETLIGTVRSLTRDEAQEDDESGMIILHAAVKGRFRNVHMTLGGEDHEWAIIAYREKLPFTVTGDLVYERRAWRLVGDLRVDSDFLRQRHRQTPPS
ncbi:hypothetical protein GCM10009555_032740 [Acrocarpospora macrocephala]|uniref:Uncharacterized protein n=1 Tax=Acrocarpospora macrocephala TaxID=150177 RepID=A0A5M3WBN9_9ACTN|nr:hypothetical protein [Acrocarpospora macrocephala]GES06455.1 hypothetical protein Amac_000500 [Acrocarpospora macrocephala]